MATWQEGNGGRFLAGIGSQNDNAPRSGDNSLALGLIRENNDFARAGGNNIGLQALQGLSGIAGMYQQEQQQQAQNAFNQAHANAWATGDNSGLIKFAQENPAFVAKAQQAVSGLDEQQRNELGQLAMQTNTALAQGPEVYSKFVTDNSDRLKRLGADPNWMLQTGISSPEQLSHLTTTMAYGAVGPDKMLEYQDKQVGRQLEQGRLDESARQANMQNETTRQGQQLSYQSAMTGHGLAAERLALDKQKFGLEVQQAQQKAEQLINAAPKLSVNMEKSIEKSTGDAAASRNAADSMTTLADTLEKEKPTPGLFGSAENMFSKLTGQDNYLRDMRVRYNQLANAQATKLLPPGPASDKDIEFARKGIPSETDNPMVMSRWLRGMAKMESNNAKFNEFKSEWMSANGNPGQSDRNRNIMGLDIKQGESLNSAAKRFLSSGSGDGNAQSQISDDDLINKYLGGK